MQGNKAPVTCDISDTVSLRIRSDGHEIFRIRAAINSINCENAGNGFFLVFGEYIFFLILKGGDYRRDFSIKAIHCPFLRTVSVNDELLALSSGVRVSVSLEKDPECTIEDVETRKESKISRYRIALSYRIVFREYGHVQENSHYTWAHQAGNNDQDSPGSGSVKVWKVNGAKGHTIEELLGIDRNTLMQFNKNQDQE